MDRNPDSDRSADPGSDPQADALVNSDELQHDLSLAVPTWAAVLLAAGLAALFLYTFGFNRLQFALVPFALFCAAVTVIDLRELRIPRDLCIAAAMAGVPLLALASTASETVAPAASFERAMAGGALHMWIFALIAIVAPQGGMGGGDVTLAPILGAMLGLFGWVPVARGILYGTIAGGVVALALVVARRAGAKSGFPYGPAMIVGAIIALIAHG